MEGLIKGLQKLVNSDIIKNIYPMIDHIVVGIYDQTFSFSYRNDKVLEFKIYLNDPEITEENMYVKGFDPHYLVEYHIKKLLPYLSLEDITNLSFIVYGTDGESITYWNDN